MANYITHCPVCDELLRVDSEDPTRIYKSCSCCGFVRQEDRGVICEVYGNYKPIDWYREEGADSFRNLIISAYRKLWADVLGRCYIIAKSFTWE